MDEKWLDSYIEAWRDHARAGGPGGKDALDRLLAFMSPDVLYEDVPTGGVFRGYSGVRAMAQGAHAMAEDMTFDITSRFVGGGGFAFEAVCRGTNNGAIGPMAGSGRSFEMRSVMVGTVSDAGLVTSQRDYWDLAGLLAQLGG